MSQANVEAHKRGVEAINRRDIEALTELLDPEVEWHDVFHLMLGGDAAVYRGHEGVRELFRDLYEVLTELHGEYSEVRDLGNRLVAIGRIRTRGRESGAQVQSPLAALVDFRNGKAIRVWTYLDPKEALEAAGLSE